MLFKNLDITIDMARHRAADKQQIRLGNHLNDAKVLHRYALSAHAPRHAHALKHPRRKGTGTDRAWSPFPVALAVRPRSASEMVAFHDALKTPAFRGSRHGNDIALGKDRVHLDFGPELKLAGIKVPELAQEALGADACPLIMPGSRFIHQSFLGLAESELKSLIAVAFLRLDVG